MGLTLAFVLLGSGLILASASIQYGSYMFLGIGILLFGTGSAVATYTEMKRMEGLSP